VECPRGVPCFMRDETEYSYTGILTVTPDKAAFVTVWSSYIRQCREQTNISVPELCDGKELGR
jgi:hypothetical protein